MQSFTALVLTSVLAVSLSKTDAYQGPPKGLQFLGVGYNLLEGRRRFVVFKLSYDTNKMSIGRQYLIPDQVSFAPRSSCVTTTKKEVFSGSKSYEKKLTVDVSANDKEQY